MVFKRSYFAIKDLYKKFTGKRSTPGQKKYMSLSEFNDLIIVSGIVADHNFGTRDINPLFTLSMMTSINELEYEKHLNMTIEEFIEALARVADNVRIKHYLEEDVDDI